MSDILLQKISETRSDEPLGWFEVLIDDAHVKVTRWTIKPGECAGWHRHRRPYLVIPQSEGQLVVINEDDSEQLIDLVPGNALKCDDVPKVHDTVNRGTKMARLLEVEFKTGG